MVGIGGRDKLCDWTKAKFDASDPKNGKFLPLCDEEPPKTFSEICFDNTTPGTAKTSA